jgi:hypothetical protein
VPVCRILSGRELITRGCLQSPLGRKRPSFAAGATSGCALADMMAAAYRSPPNLSGRAYNSLHHRSMLGGMVVARSHYRRARARARQLAPLPQGGAVFGARF